MDKFLITPKVNVKRELKETASTVIKVISKNDVPGKRITRGGGSFFHSSKLKVDDLFFIQGIFESIVVGYLRFQF